MVRFGFSCQRCLNAQSFGKELQLAVGQMIVNPTGMDCQVHPTRDDPAARITIVVIAAHSSLGIT